MGAIKQHQTKHNERYDYGSNFNDSIYHKNTLTMLHYIYESNNAENAYKKIN